MSTTFDESTLLENGQIDPRAYWHERNLYRRQLRRRTGMRIRYLRSLGVYALRRLLWSFAFFPVFMTVWLPLVLARFNPVVVAQDLLPRLQAYTATDPQQQAIAMETLLLAWVSIGTIFLVFDLILTPFRNPYDYEANIHMRAWVEVQRERQRAMPDSSAT